ncbi:CAP domain-containing protein [Streptomyces sp. MB09-01]|uniref:CAP domain-containing protein n=1 Tax=Streptomyces sp. MB09-01 TaxID=3028666 RepID=UPI0029B0EDCB|nr:CAP domain-containing protein [Streptomyces sp. MB09-01]MDX3539000.1 CAP domain-containing protein [Streptomyces sp. MB09-01]
MHNEARREAVKKYNPGLPVVSLAWNPKLACDAQAWADDPASSQGGTLHHSSRATNGNAGENLFNAYPGPPRPMMALDPAVSFSWIAEKSKFDADNNAPVNSSASPGTNYRAWGHYSQMVWMSPASSTTEIGCGVKQGVPVASSTGWILVCRYIAAGNINGQRAVPQTATPAACDPAAANRAPTAATAAQARDAVRCLINAQRTQRGLPALTVNQALTNAAQQHAVAAVQLKWWGPGRDSHRNPQTGSTPRSRIQAAGYCPNARSWEFGELTYTGRGGSGTPQAAVNWWMNSPGHRALILNASLREMGPSAQPGSADQAGASSTGAGTYVVTLGRCQQ